MVTKEIAVKAHARTQLIVNEPNFRENIYDDPKKLYDDYCKYEIELTTAIDRIQLTTINIMNETIGWDIEAFTVNAYGDSIEKRNGAIYELDKLKKHLVYLHTEVVRIIKTKFDQRFTLIERDHDGMSYEEPEASTVFFFKQKEAMLNYIKLTEEEFYRLEAHKLTETCFPILTNTLRFHGLNFKSDEFRTSYKFELCRHCTELEDGKWAVVINYDC